MPVSVAPLHETHHLINKTWFCGPYASFRTGQAVQTRMVYGPNRSQCSAVNDAQRCRQMHTCKSSKMQEFDKPEKGDIAFMPWTNNPETCTWLSHISMD